MTEGIDALGTVTVKLRAEDRLFSGQASDTDIVVAAAHAYVNAVNRVHRHQKVQQAQQAQRPQLDTAGILF